MPYQTGSASSATDLLQKLNTWLVASGWTSDRSASEGSGWTVTAHLGSNFVNLRASENEVPSWASGFGVTHYGISMYLGTGFNSGNNWAGQAGGPQGNGTTDTIGVGMRLSAGPFSNYYFFADSGGDNVVVVCEKTPGLFVYLGWGSSLKKAGSWTGGAYFFGSCSGFYTSYSFAGANTPGFTDTSDCPGTNLDAIGGGCGFVLADVDSFTGKWIGIYSSTGADQGYTGKTGQSSVLQKNGSISPQTWPVYAYSTTNSNFQYMQTSQQDSRANLLPIFLWVNRDGTTTGFSLLGSIPNSFCTNGVGHGFSNADEYVIGSDTYKMFPNFAVLKQV
jgi:hypothetical protein